MIKLKVLPIFLLFIVSTSLWGLEYTLTPQNVTQYKTVYGTIEPTDITFARVRNPGIIDGLSIDEGDLVKHGDLLAVVVDEKQPLQIATLDAQIKSLQAELELTQIELNRIKVLVNKQVVSQSELDTVSAKETILKNRIQSLNSEKEVVIQKQGEGKILAPSTGRVLKVNVVNGSVVQPGESIAEVAVENYVARIQLPERHAQHLNKQTNVMIVMKDKRQPAKITQVYPKIVGGAVVADIQLDDIQNYFVGQRIQVEVPVGHRQVLLLPKKALTVKFGLHYVTLADGQQITIQVVDHDKQTVEVLSGLTANDVVVIHE